MTQPTRYTEITDSGEIVSIWCHEGAMVITTADRVIVRELPKPRPRWPIAVAITAWVAGAFTSMLIGWDPAPSGYLAIAIGIVWATMGRRS